MPAVLQVRINARVPLSLLAFSQERQPARSIKGRDDVKRLHTCHLLLWFFINALAFSFSMSLAPVEAVVEFDYEAQQDDELSLTVGDIIVNIRRDDGGWWEGELGGRRGLFPDNFVRVSNHKLPPHFFLSAHSQSLPRFMKPTRGPP